MKGDSKFQKITTIHSHKHCMTDSSFKTENQIPKHGGTDATGLNVQVFHFGNQLATALPNVAKMIPEQERIAHLKFASVECEPIRLAARSRMKCSEYLVPLAESSCSGIGAALNKIPREGERLKERGQFDYPARPR